MTSLSNLLAEQEAVLRGRDQEIQKYYNAIPKNPWSGWWGLWSYYDKCYKDLHISQEEGTITAKWQGDNTIYSFRGELSESGMQCVGAKCFNSQGKFVGPLTMHLSHDCRTITVNWEWNVPYPTLQNKARKIARAMPSHFFIVSTPDILTRLAGHYNQACLLVRRSPRWKHHGDAVPRFESDTDQFLDVQHVLRECSIQRKFAIWEADNDLIAECEAMEVPFYYVIIEAESEEASDPDAVPTVVIERPASRSHLSTLCTPESFGQPDSNPEDVPAMSLRSADHTLHETYPGQLVASLIDLIRSLNPFRAEPWSCE